MNGLPVLADDSILVREGVAPSPDRRWISTVVTQVSDADALLRTTEKLLPDVAIVDDPDKPTNTDEGLRAAHAIEHGTAVGILVLSRHVEPSFALPLMGDGAGGISYLYSRTESPTSRILPTRSDRWH